MKITLKMVILTAVVPALASFSGCTVSGSPRVRLGSYATSTPGTNFIDLDSLGRHNYSVFLLENNGIVYTCRGGHVDIAHVRIGADNTKYLYYKVRKALLRNDSTIKFKLNVEPSRYFVDIEYPPYWKDLSKNEKRLIADQLALELSQYFTFTMTTWHEVLTWFGYKCMAFLPEKPSAFSWEDIYSNLVGIQIGAQAVLDKEHSYNEAVTIAMKKELLDLGIQPRQTAWQAAEKMRGIWFDGLVLVDMKERNFDIGIDDGLVTPTLVPGICEDAEPESLPIPTLEKFDRYGFMMDLEVEPKEFEKGKVLKIIYPHGEGKRIKPLKHIPIVIDYIKKIHTDYLNGLSKKNHQTP